MKTKLDSLIKVALKDLNEDVRGDIRGDVNYYSGIYRRGLIGRGNKNPTALTDIEKELYNKLNLSDKEKNKSYLFSRLQTLGKNGLRRQYYAKTRLEHLK